MRRRNSSSARTLGALRVAAFQIATQVEVELGGGQGRRHGQRDGTSTGSAVSERPRDEGATAWARKTGEDVKLAKPIQRGPRRLEM